jgi:hypothetical protein
MKTHVMPSERLSKKMQLVLYLARKSTRMATYDELVEYFVNEKGWSRALLNAYLSELAKKRVIRRAWIRVGGRRHRVYRLNEQGGSP